MNIAKPPGGFEVRLSRAVQAFVDGMFSDDPELQNSWRPLMARLRDSGHTVGEVYRTDPSQRIGIFRPTATGPVFSLAWHVLGDTVTVVKADF